MNSKVWGPEEACNGAEMEEIRADRQGYEKSRGPM
jgi:hypothetical protein